MPAIELSYCIVNTSQRELLLRGLDAIEGERAALPFATEVLVLDNGSRDGSAQAAQAHPAVDELIALEERRGKAANDSELLRRARGRYALLLNEDSELLSGATLALHEALERHPKAACAGAKLLRPYDADGLPRPGGGGGQRQPDDADDLPRPGGGGGQRQPDDADDLPRPGGGGGQRQPDDADDLPRPGGGGGRWQPDDADDQLPHPDIAGAGQRRRDETHVAEPFPAAQDPRKVRPRGGAPACAWRFPTPLTALAGALFLHRLYTVQSKGERTREVDWCQSSALLVRREAAEQIDYLDPDFFVYSDEVDFARRLRDAGWRSLYVPGAVAVHHEQLSTGAVPERRIVELARNRDLYMRKHHSPAAALTVRWLTAWSYALRALAALLLPGHSPKRYWRHVTASLWPSRGEGLREGAARYNRHEDE